MEDSCCERSMAFRSCLGEHGCFETSCSCPLFASRPRERISHGFDQGYSLDGWLEICSEDKQRNMEAIQAKHDVYKWARKYKYKWTVTSKRQKVDSITPAPDVDPGVPKVLFTLYSKSQVNRLESIIRKLGGITVTNPRHCTHLVCPSLVRTIKFFVAINTCHYIVTKEWLEDSSIQEKFLDESDYALKDEMGEASFNCHLAESLRRARSRQLFQGLTFYITPSVAPPACELISIIESAGGIVVKRRPSVKQITASLDEKGNPKIIVITCLNDLHLSLDLRNRKLPVFNAEFVLTGVMRQEVDYNIFRITATQ